jgi:GTPase SAR1 family protein
VGNKCDLPEEERQVSKEEGQKLAQELGGEPLTKWLEVSAKENINVTEIFNQVGHQNDNAQGGNS